MGELRKDRRGLFQISGKETQSKNAKKAILNTTRGY
jgi:hypothetical protein